MSITTPIASLAFYPAEADLAEAARGWVQLLAVERRLSPLSVEAYARDLRQFITFLAEYQGERPRLATLDALTPPDVRAFMARRRLAQIGNRSLLRQLAGVRSFVRYCEREGLAKTGAFSAVRAPKLPRTLPKPLSPTLACEVVSGDGFVGEERPAWTLARDTAVLALLYGAGLRISEALAIKRAEAPVSGVEGITVLGKGRKMRQVPIIEPVRAAVERYIALCPFSLPPQGPLFIGVRQGPLSPRIIQLSIERLRGALGLPARRPRMRCAIPSRRTCSAAAAICGRSRSCSATARCRQRRSTRPWDGARLLESYRANHPRARATS